MKTIQITYLHEVPKNYTGIVEYMWGGECLFKVYASNSKHHRDDGPAVEHVNGDYEYWYKGKWLNSSKVEELIKLGYPTKTAIKLASMAKS